MSNTVNNQELKDSLELLARKAFDIYNRELDQYPPSNDPQQTFLLIIQLQLESRVKTLDEFKRCVEFANSDFHITSLIGEMVGTTTQRATVPDVDYCIMRFVNGLYLKNRTFDLALFNEYYEAFEEFFYSDVLRFVDTVRLCNFESEVDEIPLQEGLGIKKQPLIEDQQTMIHEMRYSPFARLFRSEFVIERTYSKPKLKGQLPQGSISEQAISEMNESGDLFDLVIKTLRMLKTSAVFRETGITTGEKTYFPYGGTSTRFSPENTVMGNKCVLSVQEANKVQTLFEQVKLLTKKQSFKIAFSRLAFGMERRFDEDKLLDYMIGLESLYLPDGIDELAFRLSLRIAFIIEQARAERKQTFNFMKKMYRLRSKIAHGKAQELTKEDMSKIEEILRQSLKMYVDNPDTFTPDKYNDKGQVVKEGMLDNIYFV